MFPAWCEVDSGDESSPRSLVVPSRCSVAGCLGRWVVWVCCPFNCCESGSRSFQQLHCEPVIRDPYTSGGKPRRARGFPIVHFHTNGFHSGCEGEPHWYTRGAPVPSQVIWLQPPAPGFAHAVRMSQWAESSIVLAVHSAVEYRRGRCLQAKLSSFGRLFACIIEAGQFHAEA